MALDRQNLITLAKTLAHAKPSSQVAYSFGEDKLSYTDLNDTLTTCILNYNGIFAGEVLFRVRHNKFIWYGKNTNKGREIYNV